MAINITHSKHAQALQKLGLSQRSFSPIASAYNLLHLIGGFESRSRRGRS